MDQIRAYSELAAELNHFRRLSFEELARRVVGPLRERVIQSPTGSLTIEVRFRWADPEEKRRKCLLP